MYNGYRFPTPDPLADKYPDLSPYVYCANNPVRFIDPDGKDLWDVMLGTAHAIGENLTLGLAQYDNSSVSSASDYNAGRSIGDVVSVVMGALEIGAGGSVSGGGVAVAVGSGGSLSLIGVPVAAEGVALAAHGVGVVTTAVKSIGKQEGRISESNKSGITNSHSKDGGKNGKKRNAKREQSWKEKEMDAKSRKKEAKTKSEKESIQKEIDHAIIKQKKSENHAKTGNRR